MKVLIVTGGLVTGVEASILSSLRKLFQQWRASEHAWLDVKIKLVFGEFLIRKPHASSEDLSAPDLTEVAAGDPARAGGYALHACDLRRSVRPARPRGATPRRSRLRVCIDHVSPRPERTEPAVTKAEEASQPDRRRRTVSEPPRRPLGRGRRRRHPGRRLWRTSHAIAGRLGCARASGRCSRRPAVESSCAGRHRLSTAACRRRPISISFRHRTGRSLKRIEASGTA